MASDTRAIGFVADFTRVVVGIAKSDGLKK